MKKLIILILSCASFLAGGQDVQVATSATTNDMAVTTTETFTRGGHTNLVRQTTTKGGVVEIRFQTFYQDGSKVATSFLIQSSPPYMSQFFTEPNTHYSVALNFSPSNEVNFLTIGSNATSVVDAFTCTNGNFYPVNMDLIGKLNTFSNKTNRAETSRSPLF